mgnify:FL=1
MTPTEYYEYFKKDLAPLSDQTLILRFNQSVELRAFDVARQGYLRAMWISLDERNIDYSAVGDDKTMRFDRKVRLVGKGVLIMEETLEVDNQKNVFGKWKLF